MTRAETRVTGDLSVHSAQAGNPAHITQDEQHNCQACLEDARREAIMDLVRAGFVKITRGKDGAIRMLPTPEAIMGLAPPGILQLISLGAELKC